MRCTDGVEPILSAGIIQMSAWCSTDTDPSNHFSADFDGQSSAQDKNLAVHVPKSLQRRNLRDEIG
jgi:hypothetical protein